MWSNCSAVQDAAVPPESRRMKRAPPALSRVPAGRYVQTLQRIKEDFLVYGKRYARTVFGVDPKVAHLGDVRPPQVGSIGTESGKNYMVGPGVNEWQMAVQRNIRITEKTKLQLRVEGVRNVFNHTQFSGVNSTAINGVRGGRVLQMVAKFTF
jgi:hypothetical protein